MKANKIYRFIPIFIGLIAFCYFYLYRFVYKNNDYFYENAINAKIIEVKNYENKSLQFYYTEKFCITTTDTQGDTLKVGDSLSKKSETNAFEVFREENESYKLYKSYKK